MALAASLAATTGLTSVAHAQYATHATRVSSADGSHPFNSAMFAQVPQNLAAVFYTENEYFLTGLAKAYKYNNPSSTTDDSVTPIQASPVPYVNRILVRLPTRLPFSGNVIVEIANDALVSDNETQWPYANSQFINNGDAYVLLTSAPSGLLTMKAYAPARYRALNWPTIAATKSCASLGEPGIIYDEITALGTLLKSNSASSPLAGYPVSHLFLTGYSGAAETLLTYNRVFGLNSPLYDGYFEVAGGFRAPLNACETSATTQGRVQPVASTVSAVFQAQTESELEAASAKGVTIPNSPDGNSATNRYRYYEIAGTAHVNADLLAHSPERNDFPTNTGVDYLAGNTEAQIRSECAEPANSVVTAFPNRYVYDALWANLEHWVASGVSYKPPAGVKITNTSPFTYLGAVAPTGGVRSPAVDVPIDGYAAGSVPPNGAPAATQTFCLLTGTQVSSGATVNAAAVKADAQSLANAGFLTAADLSILAATPSLAYTFPNGTTTVP